MLKCYQFVTLSADHQEHICALLKELESLDSSETSRVARKSNLSLATPIKCSFGSVNIGIAV